MPDGPLDGDLIENYLLHIPTSLFLRLRVNIIEGLAFHSSYTAVLIVSVLRRVKRSARLLNVHR